MKLTKTLKAEILQKALELALKKDEQEIVDRRIALAEKARRLVLSEADEKAFEKIESDLKAMNKKLGGNCYVYNLTTSTITLNIMGEVHDYGFSGDRYGYHRHDAVSILGQQRLVHKVYIKNGRLNISEEKHPDIVKEHQEIIRLDSVFVEKAKSLQASVNACLNSVSTDKQLLQIWPEAKDLIPKPEVKEAAKLPAVKTEELNKLIGLPVEESAA